MGDTKAPVVIRGLSLILERRLRSIFRITLAAAKSSAFAFIEWPTEGEGVEP